jgi:Protein of unknown function (DUF1553)
MLIRGQYDRPGEEVTAGVPSALPPMAEGLAANRLGLAEWLVQDDHPLTARVAVNRYWQMLFGAGIVETAEDFGVRGQLPTHPEMLDWLAADFRDHGWSVRRLLKTIVMSSTYRQSSCLTPESAERDPYNRWCGRAPRFRLPAEFVRDNALALGGLLSRRIGGPSVYPIQPPDLWKEVSHFGHPTVFTAQAFYPSRGESLYRRSMYSFWKRTSPPPAMTCFDAPSRETCTVRRLRTNTPLQSLVLMNDPQYLAAAKSFGRRIAQRGGGDVEQRVDYAFRSATGRHPEEKEAEILTRTLIRQLKVFRADPSRARSLLDSPGDADPDANAPDRSLADDETATLAAYMVLAGTILNLDETITRQ